MDTRRLIDGFLASRNQELKEKVRFLNQNIVHAKSVNGYPTEVEFYVAKKDATSLKNFFTLEEKTSLGITNNFIVENNQYPVRIILKTFEKYLQDNGFTDLCKNNDTDTDDNNNTSPPVDQNTNTESIKELIQQAELIVSSATFPLNVSSNMTQPTLDGYGTQYGIPQIDPTSANLDGYGTQYGIPQIDPTSANLDGYETQYGTPQIYPTSTNVYGYGTQYGIPQIDPTSANLDGYETQYGTPQIDPTSTNVYGYETQYGTPQIDPTSTNVYGYGTQYGTPQIYPTSTNVYGYETQYETQQSDPTFTETLVGNNRFLINHQQIAFSLGITGEYKKSCLESGHDSWPQYSAGTPHSFEELDFSTFNNPNQSKKQITSTSHDDDNNNRKRTPSNKKLKDSERSDYSSDPDKTESDSDNDFKGKRKPGKSRFFSKKRRSKGTSTISNVSNNESTEIKTGNQSSTSGLQKK